MKTTRILALLLALLTVFSALALTGCNENAKKPEETAAQTEKEDAKAEAETEKEEKKEKEESKSSVINSSANYEYYGTDWINALEFGLVGDGKTLNDQKMTEYIKYYSDSPMYFPKGVYVFEKSINFPRNAYLQLDPGAELKCVAEEPLDYFITIRKDVFNWVTIDKYSKSYIIGGTINCNYKAKTGIAVAQCYHARFESFTLMNVLEKGIDTWYNTNDLRDGAFMGRDLVIYNDQALKGTIGIYDNHWDTNVYESSIINFETAIYTIGGRFYEVQAWTTKMDRIERTVFATIAGGHQSTFDNCSIDTYRYGFKIMGDAGCQITNLNWITNAVFYTEALQQKYPRTIFMCEKPELAAVYAVNIAIPAEQYLSFSNAEMPGSIFLNTRIASNFDVSGIKYYRNDTQALLDLIFDK